MKKVLILFTILILFLCPIGVSAVSDTSRASVVMDIDSGRILYSKNMNERRLIASITKIMTSVVAMEHGKLKDKVTVGEEVLKMYGSNIYIELNEEMSLEDLLYGLLLRSGNDSAVVIAHHISKNEEEFVKLMNEKAKELGMSNTTFSNCHGLDEETKNYSTAKDMSILSSYAYKNLSAYRKITGTKEHVVKSKDKTYLWQNRNKLLNLYDKATGGKTGYTPSAGRTLVTTAKDGNFNLTITTLDDGNEYDTHENLYEYVFGTYKNYVIVEKGDFKVDDAFFNGKLYTKDSYSYPLTEEEVNSVKTVLKLNKIKKYKNGDVVGDIEVKLYDKTLKTVNVYAKEKKQKKGFFSLFQ